MGLGKTLQSISVLVYMKEYRNETGPHLIVVPKSTLSNWMNEIGRWAPGLSAVKFHGDKAAREALIRSRLEPAHEDDCRDWNVLVTTYEICNIERNALKKFAWSYLIIDEAHRLKNEASTFSQTIRGFETRYRLLLTGTPLQNSLVRSFYFLFSKIANTTDYCIVFTDLHTCTLFLLHVLAARTLGLAEFPSS